VVWLTGGSRVVPVRRELVLGDFDCVLDGEALTATPRGTYHSDLEAEAALDPHLRTWELELELNRGYRMEFRFRTSSAVADGDDGGTTHHFLRARFSATAAVYAELSVHATLPGPNGMYRSSPLIEQYLTRLRDVQEGREKVPAAAYWFVTDLEDKFGNGDQGAAARALHISSNLLRQVRTLSNREHPTKGRKTAKDIPPLTEEDLDWLWRVLPVLVRRAAAVESGAAELEELTLADV
jgi:hypothetical protein